MVSFSEHFLLHCKTCLAPLPSRRKGMGWETKVEGFQSLTLILAWQGLLLKRGDGKKSI